VFEIRGTVTDRQVVANRLGLSRSAIVFGEVGAAVMAWPVAMF
jgi:hypothetical protein